jgi:glyoxylase-like metal-dependent hydrolase (beta-lactamase superfamily II)
MSFDKLYIRQLAVGPMANFVYLVGAADSGEAVLIDASWDAERIMQAAKEDKRRLKAIVLTHAHYDHVQALPELVQHLGLPVLLQQAELDFVKQWTARHPAAPGPFCPRFCALLQSAPETFHALQPDVSVPLAGAKMQMLLTPGHSVGSQCIGAEGALFTGDTLFVGACGRVDLPGGDIHQLQQSLQVKLQTLPPETTVYPGHDYGTAPTSTLAKERRHNPYLKDRESFLGLRSNETTQKA